MKYSSLFLTVGVALAGCMPGATRSPDARLAPPSGSIASQGSPFLAFTCPDATGRTCASAIGKDQWKTMLEAALEKKDISVGDACDLTQGETAVSYVYAESSSSPETRSNGVALLRTNGQLIAKAQDAGYPSLEAPRFHCQSGSTVEFRFQSGGPGAASHAQTFVAGAAEKRVDLLDAVHETRAIQPCDGEECFLY